MKFFGPSLRQAPHERWISLRTKREVLSQTLSFFSVGFPNFSANEHQAVNNDRQLHLHAIFLLAFRTAQQIKKPIKARATFPARDFTPAFPYLSSRFCLFLSASPSTNAASSNFDSLSACRFSRLRRASSAWRRFSAASRSCSSWGNNGEKRVSQGCSAITQV